MRRRAALAFSLTPLTGPGLAPREPHSVQRAPHRVAYDVHVVWFFERGNELLRVETSYDRVAGVFLLRAQRPDGTEEVEKFSDEIACQQRLEALDNQLRSERWGLKQVQPLDTAH